MRSSDTLAELGLPRLGRLAVLTMLAALIGSPLCRAQSPAPASAAQPVRIALRQSQMKLNGPWRFHIGDSPTQPGTNLPLWATAQFDDRDWESVDLTPAAGAFDPTLGFGEYVKGWTARGHPGYFGYAWYRLRVEIDAPDRQDLALEGPMNVDDVYQVFVNGRPLGSFGSFPADGKPPKSYVTRPASFTLPRSWLTAGPGNTYIAEIALRVWMDAATLQVQPDVGGLHSAPLLGYADAVDAAYQLGWWQQIRSFVAYPILATLFLLLALITFSLRFVDRTDPTYLWLAGNFVLISVAEIQLAILCWTEAEALSAYALTMLDPLILGGWVMVWWHWFRLKRPAWMPPLIVALSLTFFFSSILGKGGLHAPPALLLAMLHILNMITPLLILGLLISIVIRGVRAHGPEGWLTVPALLLVGIAQFQEQLEILHVRVIFFPFGVQILLSDIANLALLAAMFILLVRRIKLSIDRQRELALDVKNAQEVQQVLLPEPVHLPGLIIETEYRPARQVGGDFFQIMPRSSDGSVLVVVGDVAGKGLPAGMLVALLVGAIRCVAEVNDDPREMLSVLNRRLLGRGNAHATCLAIHIAPDRTMTLANAGHLPPYLNGVEVEMDGALPLGTIADAEFPVTQLKLTGDDHLLFVSDGVVEAQDKTGELFGFDRLTELLRQRKTAAQVADMAQQFGQEDDISVVSILCLSGAMR